ncbi:M16 family metallopeptidase [Mucilaginibacter boryungensis]|uniref:Insulinase family protein n=1 Tax=Mucilaginibacter boryungensis TaxID=768480 RepID=A0ABR9XC84_9SPHI|nr:pitrilysin family protein [Mucilaginibacter boryungensis]MBE9665003.1 insulinase family protein [Mucilaginibacter boryungensis]
MKKHMFLLLLTASVFSINAANAQTTQPYEMTVSGVKVIVQPSGNDIVEIQTVIKGGVQNYPAAKAGIESLAMTGLTECGTAQQDKNSFKNKLEKLGAQISAGTSKDYSVVRMNCIKSDFEGSWKLYVEALTMPKYDEKEFARIKQNALTGLKRMESIPDIAIDNFADRVAFEGRAYAVNPSGTIESVTALTAADVKAYYQGILTKSKMFIVVVADLDRADIEGKVKAMLSGIKQGAPFTLKKSFFRPYKSTFSADSRELATNYIEGVTSGPQPGEADFDAFNIAMRIFYDRHFLDVRTNNGLSYAPQTRFAVGTTSVAKVNVSTTQPDKYIAVFDKLVDKTKSGGFTEDEVKNMKATYLTGVYYRNETNSAQAGALASNEVLFNDWKRTNNLVDHIKKLTPTQISDAFRKYIGNMVWVYQGDTKKVTPTLFTNGTLHKADNPVMQ